MPNGDAALAAGMDPVDPETDLVKDGYDAINYALDQIALRTNEVTPVAQGGTGSTNAAGARANLGVTAANIPSNGVDGLGVNAKVQTDLQFLNTRINGVVTEIGSLQGSVGSAAATANEAHTRATEAKQGNLWNDSYNRNITWTRRGAWLGDNGQLGWASSRRDAKQDFEAPMWTLEQMRSIPILHYRYRAAVAAEQAGDERARIEVGSIADDLHALGLWEFVAYDGRGESAIPVGIHYELLSLAAIWLGQQLADRIAALDARIAALEERDQAS